MRPLSNNSCCGRAPESKETLVADAGLDRLDAACLEIARCFFATFAAPESQNWICAFSIARGLFTLQDGANIALQLLKLLQAVRQSRVSVFQFNSANCSGCARWLTEHERRLMKAITELRRGHQERALLQMMLLCEGNDTNRVMIELKELVQILQIVQPEFAT